MYFTNLMASADAIKFVKLLLIINQNTGHRVI